MFLSFPSSTCLEYFGLSFFPNPTSPWYNHTGWLGVKHQFTYLLPYPTPPPCLKLSPSIGIWCIASHIIIFLSSTYTCVILTYSWSQWQRNSSPRSLPPWMRTTRARASSAAASWHARSTRSAAPSTRTACTTCTRIYWSVWTTAVMRCGWWWPTPSWHTLTASRITTKWICTARTLRLCTKGCWCTWMTLRPGYRRLFSVSGFLLSLLLLLSMFCLVFFSVCILFFFFSPLRLLMLLLSMFFCLEFFPICILFCFFFPIFFCCCYVLLSSLLLCLYLVLLLFSLLLLLPSVFFCLVFFSICILFCFFFSSFFLRCCHLCSSVKSSSLSVYCSHSFFPSSSAAAVCVLLSSLLFCLYVVLFLLFSPSPTNASFSSTSSFFSSSFSFELI